ncbi:hypothetical protein ABW21_db0201174 [Orbilia brochopaga]|nr:hypothetical protein ABW21_db0201174 [Drechslerella brochopaga]
MARCVVPIAADTPRMVQPMKLLSRRELLKRIKRLERDLAKLQTEVAQIKKQLQDLGAEWSKPLSDSELILETQNLIGMESEKPQGQAGTGITTKLEVESDREEAELEATVPKKALKGSGKRKLGIWHCLRKS